MSETPIKLETRGHVLIITLNRPERRNAVNGALAQGLSRALRDYEANPDLRVAVIHGEGKVFCAGMDLAAFAAGEMADIVGCEGGFAGIVERQRKKPLIAAVHGAAVAGGFEIALACDLLVAEEGSRFGAPEVLRGLIAGAGAAMNLARLAPPARAREILLTGRLFDAAEAWDLGLVSRRAGPGQALEVALQLAEEIAANAPLAVSGTLQVSRLQEARDHAAMWQANNTAIATANGSEDAKEGAQAFLERRAPVWKGR